MTNGRRIQKVASLLKKELSLIFMNDLEDRLISENFVSITKIELSGDLQHCKIFISSPADPKLRDLIIQNLNDCKNNIRRLLSKRIVMRRIPEITFKEDKVLDQEISVLRVLDDLRKQNME